MTEATTDTPGSELAPVVPPDAVTTALTTTTSKYAQVTALVAKGKDLAERYEGVVADVTTTKGYEQIAAIRREFRDEVRYPLQHLRDDISKTLGTLQRKTNAQVDEYIAEALGFEKPFDQLLTAEDERKEAERQRRAAEEQKRKDGHLQAIAEMLRLPSTVAGMDSAAIAQVIAGARELVVDESFEEFQGQAMQAKDEAIRQLEGLRIAALADEEDRREAEEARRLQAALAEQQRQRAEAAERDAEANRQAAAAALAQAQELREKLANMEKAEADRKAAEAAIVAERERAARDREAGISRRINAIAHEGAAFSHMAPSENIRKALDQLTATSIDADLFGDRIEEAQRAKDIAIGNLREVLAGAEAREAEEAAAALRAKREEMLANIIGMGDNALLAVQDGSADVEQLHANLYILDGTYNTEELFGDLQAQAGAALAEAKRKTQEAIAATEERDRLAAEEATRRAQEEAEEHAARALAERKRFNGEELYELVRDFVINGYYRDVARDALLKINPAEDFDA